jgi:hypothetical protein
MLINIESGDSDPGVERDCLNLEVKEQDVVQEILNLKRYLGSADRPVVRKLNFHWNVNRGIVVRMGVIGQSHGQ